MPVKICILERFPFLDGFHLCGIAGYTFRAYYLTYIVDFILQKFTLGWLQFKPGILQPFEDFL